MKTRHWTRIRVDEVRRKSWNQDRIMSLIRDDWMKSLSDRFSGFDLWFELQYYPKAEVERGGLMKELHWVDVRIDEMREKAFNTDRITLRIKDWMKSRSIRFKRFDLWLESKLKRRIEP